MRRSFFAAASLLLVSCSDPTSPVDDLRVTVSVAPSVIRAGEATTVVVAVTNEGSHTHHLNTNCVSAFVVAADDGSVVGPPAMICTLVPVPPTKLPPGEELTIIRQWYGDGFGDGASESSRWLSPGTYLLRGSVSAGGADPVIGPPVAITIRD